MLTHQLVMAYPLNIAGSFLLWKVFFFFYSALLVQKVQDAQLGFDQIYTWLVVVEVNERP